MPSITPYLSSGSVTGDTLVCTGSGLLHTITISQNDAAPTAGTIDVRDGVAAAGGTLLWSWTLTTAVFIPFTITFDIPFTTGLYLDFTTTADVNVVATYLESSSSGVL
jgi:hypothetical protein